MNLEYVKSQMIPKNNRLKVIYGILWVLEPGLMALFVSLKIVWNRKHESRS